MFCRFEESCHYRKELYLLKEKMKEMEKIMEQATDTIKSLKEENQRLKEKCENLIQKLKAKVKKIFKPNLKEEKERSKKGAPAGHKGISRMKPQIIDEYVDIYPKRCSVCGSDDITIYQDTFDEHILEDIEIRRKNTCFRKHWGYCKICKKTIYPKQCDVPSDDRIGSYAKAIGAYFRYLGIPYRKVQNIFKDIFGMDVSHTTFVNIDNDIGEKGISIYEKLKLKVRYSDFIHVDETGWRVDGVNFWLWCFVNSDVVLYYIDKSRGSNVVKEILGERYEGILISDCYSAYNVISAQRKQKCIAHILRDIKDTEERNNLVNPDKLFCESLKETLKEALNSYKEYKDDKITKEELAQTKEKTIDKLLKIVSTTLQNPELETLRKRILRHNEELLTFFDLKDIEPTNNRAERQLRPNVIMRKITFGNRSDTGARNHSIIMSILQTAKLQKIRLIDIFLSLVNKNYSELFGKIRAPCK